MQNKLLKILYNKDRRYSTNTLHHEFKLLQVKDIHELLLLKFIHNVLNGHPVKRFETYFIKRRQTMIMKRDKQILFRQLNAKLHMENDGCIISVQQNGITQKKP